MSTCTTPSAEEASEDRDGEGATVEEEDEEDADMKPSRTAAGVAGRDRSDGARETEKSHAAAAKSREAEVETTEEGGEMTRGMNDDVDEEGVCFFDTFAGSFPPPVQAAACCCCCSSCFLGDPVGSESSCSLYRAARRKICSNVV